MVTVCTHVINILCIKILQSVLFSVIPSIDFDESTRMGKGKKIESNKREETKTITADVHETDHSNKKMSYIRQTENNKKILYITDSDKRGISFNSDINIFFIVGLHKDSHINEKLNFSIDGHEETDFRIKDMRGLGEKAGTGGMGILHPIKYAKRLKKKVFKKISQEKVLTENGVSTSRRTVSKRAKDGGYTVFLVDSETVIPRLFMKRGYTTPNAEAIACSMKNIENIDIYGPDDNNKKDDIIGTEVNFKTRMRYLLTNEAKEVLMKSSIVLTYKKDRKPHEDRFVLSSPKFDKYKHGDFVDTMFQYVKKWCIYIADLLIKERIKEGIKIKEQKGDRALAITASIMVLCKNVFLQKIVKKRSEKNGVKPVRYIRNTIKNAGFKVIDYLITKIRKVCPQEHLMVVISMILNPYCIRMILIILEKIAMGNGYLFDINLCDEWIGGLFLPSKSAIGKKKISIDRSEKKISEEEFDDIIDEASYKRHISSIDLLNEEDKMREYLKSFRNRRKRGSEKDVSFYDCFDEKGEMLVKEHRENATSFCIGSVPSFISTIPIVNDANIKVIDIFDDTNFTSSRNTGYKNEDRKRKIRDTDVISAKYRRLNSSVEEVKDYVSKDFPICRQTMSSGKDIINTLKTSRIPVECLYAMRLPSRESKQRSDIIEQRKCIREQQRLKRKIEMLERSRVVRVGKKNGIINEQTKKKKRLGNDIKKYMEKGNKKTENKKNVKNSVRFDLDDEEGETEDCTSGKKDERKDDDSSNNDDDSSSNNSSSNDDSEEEEEHDISDDDEEESKDVDNEI